MSHDIVLHIRKLVLICIILMYAVWLSLIIALSAVIIKGSSSALTIVYAAIAIIIFLSFIVWLTRFPFKTLITPTSISTISVRGKKTVDFLSLTSVKRVVLLPARGLGTVYCLKCKDSKGEVVFLQLGSVSKNERKLAFQGLVDGFKVSPAPNDDKVGELMQKWFRFI